MKDLINKYFIFDNVKLAYTDNQGEGKTILVTHANGYSSSCYHFLYRKYGDRHRWIFLDFLGHGRSEPSLNFHNWDYFKDQILALIQKENLSNIIGVGHSLGGASLCLASKSSPSSFQSLLLLDPTVLNSGIIFLGMIFGNKLSKDALKRRRQFKDKEQVFKVFRRFPLYVKWNQDIFNDYVNSCFTEKENGVVLSCPPEVESKIFNSVPLFFPLKYKNIPVKVRIIIPQKYPVCTPYAAKKLIGKNKQSSFKLLEGENHLFPFEKPDYVLQELEILLNE